MAENTRCFRASAAAAWSDSVAMVNDLLAGIKALLTADLANGCVSAEGNGIRLSIGLNAEIIAAYSF